MGGAAGESAINFHGPVDILVDGLSRPGMGICVFGAYGVSFHDVGGHMTYEAELMAFVGPLYTGDRITSV